MWAIWGRLKDLGLSGFPQAFIKTIHTFIIPSLTFGISLWGARDICDIVFDGSSPYTHEAMVDLLKVIKSIYNLPRSAFNAPIYKMLNIKSILAIALP
jgi:hypothetical protein